MTQRLVIFLVAIAVETAVLSSAALALQGPPADANIDRLSQQLQKPE